MSRPRAKLTQNFPGCPVEATLSFLDGKWKGVILFHLMGGTLRFNELRRKLPSVTQRMLTKQLRELEEAGLISRTVFPVVPPRVDYELTVAGRSLQPVIAALAAWGQENVICAAGKSSVRPFDDAEGASGALCREFEAVG
ncbi:helix-turn-helix transcriptional regulator [Rhizobiaceae bacterium n13]|uniref:Helix-turn-helix transcriptional regulator n=1 Tax=Ferirhizobium litorale TaxID=2927786 RepID=A0AAE3TZU0_9HYPH|nr:helix-turn-helix domain-containing protein [Fererhizobium litorale]MDI7861222.1 helix-turn-helix transcriptional regulator [Fererhizobium litorale]MDI7921369.1 helix-turn-helix transcriptional regulator [Fererhizobium litorale]